MDSIKVGFNRYGKANVRILKIDKITSTKHEMKVFFFINYFILNDI